MQIETTRRLDRRFGAATLIEPLRLHIDHVETLFTHTTTGATVRALAAVLTEAHALATWQVLDLGRLTDAWHHSRRACDTARVAESPAMLAHALAEQTVILAEAGHTAESAELADHARGTGALSSPLLRSWLAAAHGEALAAHGHRDACLRAFDDAAQLLPEHAEPDFREPYVALAPGHLVRWRGHALSRFGHPDAVDVLQAALASHDTEFTRAEAGLHADLASALLSAGDPDGAARHHGRGRSVADTVRSARQRRRLDALPL